MRFGSTEIGGKETGPVSIRTEGDHDRAMQYVDYGRRCLGELKRRIQLSPMVYKVGQATWKIENDPKIEITVKSNMIGLADIDEILIKVDKHAGTITKVIGFVVHANVPDDTDEWGAPLYCARIFIDDVNKQNTGERYDSLYCDTRGNGRTEEIANPQGLIEGTVDDETNYHITGFFYGQQPYSVHDTVEIGSPPSARINTEEGTPTATPDLVATQGWEPVFDIGQVKGWNYTGEDEGGWHITPVYGDWPVCAYYNSMVWGSGSIQNIVSYNWQASASYNMADANAHISQSYSEQSAVWQSQHNTNIDETYQYAPCEAQRTDDVHIALSAVKPTVAMGRLDLEASDYDCVVTVMPIHMDFVFKNKNYWIDRDTNNSTHSDSSQWSPNLPNYPLYYMFGGFPCVTGWNESMMGLGYTDVLVADSVEFSYTTVVASTPSFHDFTAKGAVNTGDYEISGRGVMKIHLLCEVADSNGNRNYVMQKVEYTLQYDENAPDCDTEKITVKVGTPFNSINEMVKVDAI